MSTAFAIPASGVRLEDGVLTAELVAAADLPWFEGHFPGNPVLPGVVQLWWAIDLAERSFDAPPLGRFAGMSRLKFKRPVGPGARLMLRLTRAGRRVRVSYLLDGLECTCGDLEYDG